MTAGPRRLLNRRSPHGVSRGRPTTRSSLGRRRGSSSEQAVPRSFAFSAPRRKPPSTQRGIDEATMAARRLPPLGDPFWAKDATGSTGLEALLRRCKDGRRTIEAMEEFVRTRSRLEDEYGKSLLKLAKTGVIKDEFGTLRAAWDRQRSQTEKVGQLHVDLSMALGELASRIHQYVPSLRDQSRKAVDLSKKYQASRAALEKKRSGWDSRRKSKEESSNSSLATSSSVTSCDDESAYASIDLMDSGRGGGNQGDQCEEYSLMDEACQIFEQMEIERCDFVRKTLWTVTNCDSLTCVERDLANEQVRSALERCSPDGDFTHFINRRRPLESAIPADPLSSPWEPSGSPSSNRNDRSAATKPTASEPNDLPVTTKPSSPVGAASGPVVMDAKHRLLLQQLSEQLAAKVASSGSRTAASGEPGEASTAGQQAMATLTSPTTAAAAAKSSDGQSLPMLPANRGPAEQTAAAAVASRAPQAERSRPRPSTKPVYEDVDFNEGAYFTLEPPKQQPPPPLPPPLSLVAAVQPPATQLQPSADCSAPQALYAVVNIGNRSSLFGRMAASTTEQEHEEPHSRLVAPDQERSPPQSLLPGGQPATALVDAAADVEAVAVDAAGAETAPSSDGD